MNPVSRNRLVLVVLIVVGVSVAVGLALVALSKNINLFYSPTQVVNGKAPRHHLFRVGGLVVPGSIKHDPKSLQMSFVLTDGANKVRVNYRGILPDLFRAGQGIVAQGRLAGNGGFVADQVLAKHDANYMPPDVKDALKTAKKLGLTNPHSQPK